MKESLYEVDDKRRGRTVLWTNNEAVAQGGDQLLTVLMKSKRGMLPPCCRALRFEKKVVRRTEGEVLGCGREKRISAVLLPGCQQIGSESTLWWQMMMKGWPPGDGVNERLDDDLKVFPSVVGALCSPVSCDVKQKQYLIV